MEKIAEKSFKNPKNQYIKKLGLHALDTAEIDLIGKSVFGTQYRGCYAQDEKFELKSGYYIINNDLAKGPGEHWVGLYLTAKTAYFYDSFARDAKKLVSVLVKRLKPRRIVNSDRKDKEQKNAEIICGHLSLAWLTVIKESGVRAAMKI